MTATERLAVIKARAEAATEEPWDADCCSAANMVYARSDHIGFDGTAADAEFIAHARTDVPQLVAALEAVLELHQPDWSDWGLDHPEEGANCSCGHNGDYEDCPTVEAITEALGVDQ